MATRYCLEDLPAELRARIVVHPFTGCWEWQHRRRNARLPDWARYGIVRWDGEVQSIHRIAYQLLVGPLDPELELDHVYALGCRSNSCCWPAHLEQVTKSENLSRGRRANVHQGVALSVQRHIALGRPRPQDEALIDAAWMLPVPDRERPPTPLAPVIDRSYYLLEEAAELTGVEIAQLVMWRKKKAGPLCYRLGRNWKYPKAHLEAWIAAHPAA